MSHMSEQFTSQESGSVTVFMYESELDFLKWLVLQKPDIETGGDLFGLWQDEGRAVVQFILGPGKDCRRTTTSFHQDVVYLREAGAYLTSSLGLCNIGEWHSHHTLGLARPSVGDQQTVWNHIPSVSGGRFLVFIANIRETVNVGCFLFNANKQKMIQGKIECLPCSSPFRPTVGTMNLTSEAEPTQNWVSFSKYQKNQSKKSSSTGREGNDTSKTSSKRKTKAKAIRNTSTTVNRLSSSSKDVKNSVEDDTRSCKTNARNDNTNNVGNEIPNAQSTQKDHGAGSSNSNTKEKPSTIERSAANLHAPSGNASAGNDNVKDAQSTRKENIGAGKSEKRKNARTDGHANVKGGGCNNSNTSSTQNGNVNARGDKAKPKGAKANTKNANSETKNSKSNSNKSGTNSNASNTTSKKKPRKGRARNKSKQKQNVKNNSEEMNEVNDGQKGTLLLMSVNHLFATFKLPMQIILPMLIILITIIV